MSLLHAEDFKLRKDRLTVAPNETELLGNRPVLGIVGPLLFQHSGDSMGDDRGPLRHGKFGMRGKRQGLLVHLPPPAARDGVMSGLGVFAEILGEVAADVAPDLFHVFPVEVPLEVVRFVLLGDVNADQFVPLPGNPGLEGLAEPFILEAVEQQVIMQCAALLEFPFPDEGDIREEFRAHEAAAKVLVVGMHLCRGDGLEITGKGQRQGVGLLVALHFRQEAHEVISRGTGKAGDGATLSASIGALIRGVWVVVWNPWEDGERAFFPDLETTGGGFRLIRGGGRRIASGFMHDRQAVHPRRGGRVLAGASIPAPHGRGVDRRSHSGTS